MATKLKANVQYQPIVESVSRKFVPKKETAKAGGEAGPVVFEASGWMGGAVRKTGRAGLGVCTRNYLVIRTMGRTTQPSPAELDARELFATVAPCVNRILHDLTQIDDVQALWMQAKDHSDKTINGVSAYGYTYRGWIFAVQYAGKQNSSSYNVNQFPTAFDA